MTIDPTTQAILLAVISTAGGGFAGWLSYKSSNRKNEADATGRITETALALVEPLKAELGRMSDKIAIMEKALSEKDYQIAVLQSAGREKDSQIELLNCKVRDLEAELGRLKGAK